MLFEKLSHEDKEKISNYINAYGLSPEHTSPTSTQAPLDYIMRHWDREKQSLYKLLGDNFIIQKHVDLQVDTQLIYNNLRDMYNSSKVLRDRMYSDILRHFYIWMDYVEREHWRYIRRLQCDMREKNQGGWENVINIHDDWFSLEALAKNAYAGQVGVTYFPDSDKPYQLKRGMRITRIIDRIRKAYGDEGFTEEDMNRLNDLLAIARSSANNSFDLCLSIHPLDYMTMSDNDKGWTSCMAWKEHTGDYRLGTVECMNSPTVLIAYIRDKNNMSLTYRDEEWANKSWRQLFIVSETSAVAVKGYPFQNDTVVGIVLDWIKELAKTNWNKDYSQSGHICDNPGRIYLEDGDDLIYEDETGRRYNPRLEFYWGYMYDDIGTLNQHNLIFDPEALANACSYENAYIHIIASGESECLWCGGEIDNDTDGDENGDGCQNLVWCSNCSPWENMCYCDHCGSRISDPIYVEDMGVYVCENCYEESIIEDDVNHHHFWDDNKADVYLAVGQNEMGKLVYMPEPMVLDREFDYDKDELADFFKNPDSVSTVITTRTHSDWGYREVVFPQDLTEKGLHFFTRASYISIEEMLEKEEATPVSDEFVANLDREKYLGPNSEHYWCRPDTNGITRWRFIN